MNLLVIGCEIFTGFLWFDLNFEGSKCVMNRRSFGFGGVAAAGLSVMGSSLATAPVQGLFHFLVLVSFYAF